MWQMEQQSSIASALFKRKSRVFYDLEWSSLFWFFNEAVALIFLIGVVSAQQKVKPKKLFPASEKDCNKQPEPHYYCPEVNGKVKLAWGLNYKTTTQWREQPGLQLAGATQNNQFMLCLGFWRPTD